MVTALLVLAIGSWIAVRPLTWLASRAAMQRDLMVAAGEAERSRLAADLHDGPLQNVLLLARRLEDTGDPEGAALAREIGRELRELSGDLRLPLLDDLGVGPAIEWLAGRVRRMTAAEVEVEIASEGRVPAQVELAAFRIAQEAIANAIRHGSSPIRVRCRTAIDALTLSVEDAGIGPNLSRELDSAGASRMGMVNMQQRADLVGARLEWSRPERGGTLVALEWRAG
jgi:signal transduction histidine kinase